MGVSKITESSPIPRSPRPAPPAKRPGGGKGQDEGQGRREGAEAAGPRFGGGVSGAGEVGPLLHGPVLEGCVAPEPLAGNREGLLFGDGHGRDLLHRLGGGHGLEGRPPGGRELGAAIDDERAEEVVDDGAAERGLLGIVPEAARPVEGVEGDAGAALQLAVEAGDDAELGEVVIDRTARLALY